MGIASSHDQLITAWRRGIVLATKNGDKHELTKHFLRVYGGNF